MAGTFHSLSYLTLLISTYSNLQIRKLGSRGYRICQKTCSQKLLKPGFEARVHLSPQRWLRLDELGWLLHRLASRGHWTQTHSYAVVRAFSLHWCHRALSRGRKKISWLQGPWEAHAIRTSTRCLKLPFNFPSISIPQFCGLPWCFHWSYSRSPAYTNSYSVFIHTAVYLIWQNNAYMTITTTTTTTLVCQNS